ncbi:MAG: AAA family ATPase, partial [Microbacteriaceae bacterium]|nr:AAA family ATPase [Microbacteriaceae bacterium]
FLDGRFAQAQKLDDHNQFKLDEDIQSLLKQMCVGLQEVLASLSPFSITTLPIDIPKCIDELSHNYDELNFIFSNSQNDQFRGMFTWRNGVVVDAALNGYWLILDNINLGNASVLDRINSILEPNGSIILTEEGQGRVVNPHPNFRIFLTMDPAYGEISRAMRNRCLEISFLEQGSPTAVTSNLLNNSYPMDYINLFSSAILSSATFNSVRTVLELSKLGNYLKPTLNSSLMERHLVTAQQLVAFFPDSFTENQYMKMMLKRSGIENTFPVSCSSDQIKLLAALLRSTQGRGHALGPKTFIALLLLSIVFSQREDTSLLPWISDIVASIHESALCRIGNFSRLLHKQGLLLNKNELESFLQLNLSEKMLFENDDFRESIKVYLFQSLVRLPDLHKADSIIRVIKYLFSSQSDLSADLELLMNLWNGGKTKNESLSRGRYLFKAEKCKNISDFIISSKFSLQGQQDFPIYALILCLS